MNLLYPLIFLAGFMGGVHVTTILWVRAIRKALKPKTPPTPRTGAERYFAERMKDPAYQQAYEDVRQGETLY